jgi:hypothetical protein
MKFDEKWVKWEPVQGMSFRYDVEYILDKFDSFEIVLIDMVDKNKKVKLVFENSVNAYRVVEESFRSQLLVEVGNFNKEYENWTFFKVENSSFLNWLYKESSGMLKELKPIQFSFITTDSIIDIVSTYHPKVEFI